MLPRAGFGKHGRFLRVAVASGRTSMAQKPAAARLRDFAKISLRIRVEPPLNLYSIHQTPLCGWRKNTMTSTLRTKVAAAASIVGIAAVLGAAAAASVAPLAAAAHDATSTPTPNANRIVGMYGDPAAAAPYWRQQHSSDCGEMAVADAVGQITGHEPTEQQINSLAESTPSTAGPGPVWHPAGNADIRNLRVLLAHYGIHADNIQTTTSALLQDLSAGRIAIVLLDAKTIWNQPGKRNSGDHFVVVTGIDTKAAVVHFNDSGITTGRDEQVPIAAFEHAWATGHNSAVVTSDSWPGDDEMFVHTILLRSQKPGYSRLTDG